MRILFVTPYVPSKVRPRPYHFIKELAKCGHKVSLACLVEPELETEYLSDVTPYCKAVYPFHMKQHKIYFRLLSSLPTRTPLSVAYCNSKTWEDLIVNLVKKETFDLIHTEFIRAAPATLSLNDYPKVYDAVDCMTLTNYRSLTAPHISPKQRLISFVEWLKMQKYEPWVLSHYDRILASSPVDQQGLLQDNMKVEVVSNGVDLEYFQYYEGIRDPVTILFLGKMSYYVNIASVLWFYHKVLPLIRRQHPEVRFMVVGRNPVPAITSLGKDPAIEVTGTVPDVRPHLAQATIAICPMVSGAGIQNKLLEAMAMGLPSVAASLACQALQTKIGHDVLVADNAEEFAITVCELLEQPEKRHQLSKNGRHYVEKHHDWSVVGNRLNDVYGSLVNE